MLLFFFFFLFLCLLFFFFFFFNDTATTEIYTLSLHDALPIWGGWWRPATQSASAGSPCSGRPSARRRRAPASDKSSPVVERNSPGSSHAKFFLRSEEHTSELQSQFHLVCRLLLEKKKKINKIQ